MPDLSKKTTAALFESIEGLKPVEVPPYFYTRLVARMQNRHEIKIEPILLLRPAFLTTSLSFLLILNILCFYQFNQRDENFTSSIPNGNNTSIDSFVDAYNLSTTSVYE